MAENREEEGLLLLRKLESKQVSSVLHTLVDGVCHRCQPSYQDYSKVWSLQQWWSVVDMYQSLIKAAVRESFTKDRIYQELGALSEDLKQTVVDVVNSRRDEIQNQLMAETHNISQAVLSDFDWKVKLIMSSDKISSVQEPVVSLDLDIGSGQDNTIHSIELNKEELDKLISSLEGANKVVQQLKA
ncbi:COMM domain-containing protein 8-like [Mizuhopecten yessoensis]|uniref:COMM domain-containing protein 8 n=1 Tax=Mizuhopecten yessoensis TaxID=6573 RepID=A0A210Q658_MIZYE|nr:COMM domain-containing protein 8-like [Mizuhopecten yessoensis]OWF44220.1 COMM domain-containing protein 8 [Mizuhopecten yessoensis]